MSNAPVCKIRFVLQQQWFNSEIYWYMWPFDNDKMPSIYKKGPPLNTSVVAVHLLLFYCHMLSGISPSIQLLGLFSESAKSTSVAGTEATIDISLYLEQ